MCVNMCVYVYISLWLKEVCIMLLFSIPIKPLPVIIYTWHLPSYKPGYVCGSGFGFIYTTQSPWANSMKAIGRQVGPEISECHYIRRIVPYQCFFQSSITLMLFSSSYFGKRLSWRLYILLIRTIFTGRKLLLVLYTLKCYISIQFLRYYIFSLSFCFFYGK